ncbi:MAG: transglutaminase domain-containing protein, partial [Candidatus Dojkabacteria bacterium]
MKYFAPFKNINFVLLTVTNFLIIVYTLCSLFYIVILGDVYVGAAPEKSEGILALTIMSITSIAGTVILFFIALSKIRTWIVFLVHTVLVIAAFVLLVFVFTAPMDGAILGGLYLSAIYYFLFGSATWFLIRLRSAGIALAFYAFTGLGTVLLANEATKQSSDDITSLIRLDILLILLGFFVLFSILLYFDSLLKFARDLRKPAVPIKKGIASVALIVLLIIIPAIVSIYLGAAHIEFQEEVKKQQELDEEIQEKKEALQEKLKQKEYPGEDEKQQNPYENPLSISSEDYQLFTIELNKKFQSFYLPAKAVSYPVWDENQAKFTVRKAEDIFPSNKTLNTLLPEQKEFDRQYNNFTDYEANYTFNQVYQSKVIPHITLPMESEQYLFLRQRDDSLLAAGNMDSLNDATITSKKVNNFFYYEDAIGESYEPNQPYLSYPSEDLRIDDLLEEIFPTGYDDLAPDDIVTEVNTFLSENYRYFPNKEVETSMENPAYGEFLFTTKEGNTLQFSEAMVIILRSLGIPSRMVTGYIGSPADALGKRFVMSESNRQFWVEVYYPFAGWTDAFPRAPYEERQALRDLQEQEQEDSLELPEDFPNQDLEELEELNEDELEELEQLEQKKKEQKEKVDNSGLTALLGMILKIVLIFLLVVL